MVSCLWGARFMELVQIPISIVFVWGIYYLCLRHLLFSADESSNMVIEVIAG